MDLPILLLVVVLVSWAPSAVVGVVLWRRYSLPAALLSEIVTEGVGIRFFWFRPIETAVFVN